MDELLKISEPIIKYIEEHYDPYIKAVIDIDGVKLVRTELSVPRKEWRPGQ